MEKVCFGIDVGGTTVKIGLFTADDAKLVDSFEIPTRKEDEGSPLRLRHLFPCFPIRKQPALPLF